MKIAIVASPVTTLSAAQAGGAQSVICDLARGLVLRGHAVQLHCAEGSNVSGVELVTVPLPTDAQAALVMPGRSPAPAPGVDAAIESMFWKIVSAKPDVVSVHAFDARAFEMAAMVPTALCTLHMPPQVPGVVEATRKVPGRRLVTVSETCRRDWQAEGVQVGHVIRNGVSAIPIRNPWFDKVALVAGRISPEKGVDHALRAARAAGLHARVAGAQYDPDYVVDLDGVEVLGALSQGDLRQVMGCSAVTVCAARWEEPFGMVAAEAQMAGCPVAAYRRGALPEVVEEGVSGFLAAPDDVEQLARAITKCLVLDRTAVRRSAERRLHIDGMLGGYEAALREVAA
jgi:glycosyltransferase involved in cell wall biosynthesis